MSQPFILFQHFPHKMEHLLKLLTAPTCLFETKFNLFHSHVHFPAYEAYNVHILMYVYILNKLHY